MSNTNTETKDVKNSKTFAERKDEAKAAASNHRGKIGLGLGTILGVLLATTVSAAVKARQGNHDQA